MSSSHRGSASSSRQRGRNVSNETRTRSTDRFKWTYEQEKKLIELFDHAISMNKYTLKDPTALGRDYIVEQFNLAFNMNITYGFFKNKLDEFKKSYKMWKFLMKSTGISVDPETSMIYASPEWWDNHEAGCRLTKSFNREPPKFWDIMVRCFALHDVYSQPQHSARQRRQEIMNERGGDDSTHGYSDFDGNEMLDTEVPDTQENEEVYRVNLDDDLHPSNEFTHDAVGINIGRGEQRGRRGSTSHSSGRRGGSLHRSGGSSGTNVGSGSRGSRRKQSFETTMQETITVFRDFQRQSLQQLLPGSFDQDDYDEWKKAEALFLDLQVTKHTKFYWKCLNTLQELKFWRKYFIDIASSTDEEKLQLLEAMIGVSRNNEDIPKQLGLGLSPGSSSSVGNNSGGQSSPGLWGPGFQQWGTPPKAQHWGTPPNAQQWGTPPNPQQWGVQPGFQQWGTPPNAQKWGTPPTGQQWSAPSTAQQWGTPSTAPQWGTPPNAQQWGTPPNAQQWNTPPNAQQWGTLPNANQWGTPPNAQQWGTQSNVQQWDTPTSAQQWGRQRPNHGNDKSAGTNPTHVQYGFSLDDHHEVSDSATKRTSPDTQQPQSPGLGFTSRFDSGQNSRQLRTGGLFNIWGNTQDNQSDDEDED